VGAQVRIQTPVAVVLVRDDHLTALDTQQELHRVPDPTGKGKPQSDTVETGFGRLLPPPA
jgi:hypothetical protein